MQDIMMENQFEDTVYALAASPAFETDSICFSAQASGLFKSTDGGQTWSSAYESLQLTTPLQTVAVALSPNFQNDRCLFAAIPGGVLRSIDGGDNWTMASLPKPFPFISAIAISPDFEEDRTVFACTMEDGVLRSEDRGASWVAWNFGLFDRAVFCIAVSPTYSKDHTVFIGTESGMFSSTSGGRGWRDLFFPAEAAPVISLALSPKFAEDGTLFAGTESAGLWVSTDCGRTWKVIDTLEIEGAINAILVSSSFPDHPDILVMFDTGVKISRDRGASWQDWKAGYDGEAGLSAISASQGLSSNAALFLGLTDGQVITI